MRNLRYKFVAVYILHAACIQTSDLILRDPKLSHPDEKYEACRVVSCCVGRCGVTWNINILNFSIWEETKVFELYSFVLKFPENGTPFPKYVGI